MGLMTILRKIKQKEKEVRILVVGLDNAGKTTFIKKINGDDVTKVAPTFGFNIYSLEHNGLKLNIWDVGGQKSLRSYWRNYFENTDGIIWVVDSCDKQRLVDCKQELHALLKEERLLGATLLVFANKQDLSGSLHQDIIRELLDLDSLTHRHWKIVGCSALTGDHLLNGIDWLTEDIQARIFNLD